METNCKTTVKHRYSNSIHKRIDMHDIGKLGNLQTLREDCIKMEMFVHQCIS